MAVFVFAGVLGVPAAVGAGVGAGVVTAGVGVLPPDGVVAEPPPDGVVAAGAPLVPPLLGCWARAGPASNVAANTATANFLSIITPLLTLGVTTASNRPAPEPNS
jgi:hypothetical protein